MKGEHNELCQKHGEGCCCCSCAKDWRLCCFANSKACGDFCPDYEKEDEVNAT